MSVSLALHDFIIEQLKANEDVAAFVSDRIWDNPPSKPEFPYISLGATDTVRDDADCIRSRDETIQIDVWVREGGRKWPCKEIVDAVVDALLDVEGELQKGALVSLNVGVVRVLDDPDGITVHGVVQVTAMIDEVFLHG